MGTPLPWLDCITSSIGSHLKSGLKGASLLKEKRWNASSQSISRESEGSLCQGFGSSMEGKRGHYKMNCPHFDHETSHDLTNIFWDMMACTSLLSSQIYEIQEFWEGLSELWYANDGLRALPKGLQFFHPISPSELPKVMDLAGIHNPDALCHFNGLTFCPWCRKEGQNEGTVVNHLQTTHYKLGLVCGTCFHCPSVTSKAILCHGWKSCQQPKGEDGDLDDTSSYA